LSFLASSLASSLASFLGGSVLISAGCSGVEADVLLLRPSGDMSQTVVPPRPPDPTRPPWPLPVPPYPRRCVLREQGDGQSCQAEDTWKWSATLDCQNQPPPISTGGTMTGSGTLHLEAIEVFGVCGRGAALYLGVRYLCCLEQNTVEIERFGADAPELNVEAQPDPDTKRRSS
jgi:hypothetical protein